MSALAGLLGSEAPPNATDTSEVLGADRVEEGLEGRIGAALGREGVPADALIREREAPDRVRESGCELGVAVEADRRQGER